MTCIVGVEHAGGVIIGGDSAGMSGWSKTIRSDEKVFTVGPCVLGFTTSFRMGQLLRYTLEVPALDGWDVDRWVATTFMDTVRATLKDGGWSKIKENREVGGAFLMGVAGRLYEVGEDYQFGRAAFGYQAVGCGDDYALGSLHTSAGFSVLSPQSRVRLALEAAATFSGACAAPFTVIDHPC